MERRATFEKLSRQACSLWAKSDYGVGEEWLPLVIHMQDSFSVIDRLWCQWVPPGVKSMLAQECGCSEEFLGRLVGFLGAIHDIGKATPVFQIGSRRHVMGEDGDLSWKPERAGLDIKSSLIGERQPKHAVAGEVILKTYLMEECAWDGKTSEGVSCIVGAHHGRPPISKTIVDAIRRPTTLGWDDQHLDSWRSAQWELIRYAQRLSGFDAMRAPAAGGFTLSPPAESVISGLVIMADWIASNQGYFPLIPVMSSVQSLSGNRDYDSWLNQRAKSAWDALNILPCWKAPILLGEAYPFVERFALPPAAEPRPVQHAVIRIAKEATDLGIMVVEAPMGEGKTEAALAAAEILASRFSRGGVCIALPTMATSDAIFSRVHAWIERLPRGDNRAESVFLAHGKAELNEEYQGILHSSHAKDRYRAVNQDADGNDGSHKTKTLAAPVAEVSDWMQGRKKGMLANFVVCTVDQVLMGALAMKHLPLRHLALANKVLIIDECHAYDVYMQQYLKRVLEWLGSWRVPVILLSATLPGHLRDEFVSSYVQGRNAARRASLRTSESKGEGAGSMRERLARRRSSVQAVSSLASVDNQPPCDASGYPLITFSDGPRVRSDSVEPSSRSQHVEFRVIPDDETCLADILKSLLAEGGCAGVVCNTVKRAQQAFSALSDVFADGEVMLTHSRFTDIDRMANESRLRSLLGPEATAGNGRRPKRMVVVGTQVIEQSLDIDFDVLVSDIAPIDLLLQRVGRLHRHARGEEGHDRPQGLRSARCLLRGIKGIEEEAPVFDRGVEAVYERASLMETLAVMGVVDMGNTVSLDLPVDIARLVREAYGSNVSEAVPASWSLRYSQAVDRRAVHQDEKRRRAETCLLKSVDMLAKNGKSLIGLFDEVVDVPNSAIRGRDDDRGPRAVRDTQETVEVLLACERDDGLHLLPWVGDESHGVEEGARISTDVEPDESIARVLSRAAVRLPIEMGRGGDIDHLLDELEKMSEPYVGAWQESGWLSGGLLVALHERERQVFCAKVLDWELEYTRGGGLSTVHGLD